MDTSEQYINMCRKATELQKDHVWEDGDFAVVHDNVLTVIGDDTITHISKDLYQYSVSGEIKKLTPLKHRVWLPRIDQLIELSAMHWSDIVDYARLDYNENQLSFEITMLKIVVYMVYRKRWNGEDWTCTSNTTA